MVYDAQRWLGGDLPRAALITGLYTLQGIPLGLVHGSLPYLLKKHLKNWVKEWVCAASPVADWVKVNA